MTSLIAIHRVLLPPYKLRPLGHNWMESPGLLSEKSIPRTRGSGPPMGKTTRHALGVLGLRVKGFRV